MNKKIGDSFMKLEYELITEENINLATSIQHTIYEEECAYIHYKFAIDTHYKENIFYIIRWNELPVGVIGLYMHDELDKNSIWLGWFGVLPEFRSKGIGRKSLLDMIEKSKEYGKKFFRLYTNDNGDSKARPLYRSVMHMFEKYENSDDYNYDGNCLVYSYSLNGDKIEPWNNRFLFLSEDKDDEYQGNELWKNKYRILILSNPENEEFVEDEYVANAFRKDGHIVKMAWVDYDEKMDEKFDVIIRRNAWVEDEKETENYGIKDDLLKRRLKGKKIKTVNLDGLDGHGKQYLCKLFEEGKNVIPTVDSLDRLNELPEAKEYVLKDSESFGSGIGQKIVSGVDLEKEFEDGYLIQPKLKFKSEVQCYFVGQNFMYAHEYVPSKYPDYPEPILIELNEKERGLAEEFAKYSCLETGFQRIDFLKLENDELILLEIEDTGPHMSLEFLETDLRERVLEEYKENVYKYLSQNE